jgi:two-component system response regulator GlrR
MAGEKILVVDDDHGLLTLMKIRLEGAGYRVTLAAGGTDALALAEDQGPELAILDLKMDGMDGITLLEHLQRRHAGFPVIILTAHGTIASAVEATKKGAYDYLPKPFDAKDLLHRIEKALEMRRLRGELERLRTLVEERYHFDHIITSSEKMQQILRQVAQLAATDSTVCLYGQSGTGKELIAKALHVASRRAACPFVAINCGAIPEGLLENELFGHVKGAFTGADQPKKGLIQQADSGTLFLDEIGELPPALQVKFLRVLQEREYYPVGAVSPVKVDLRLLVATNQNLEEAVKVGKFREDLYYRIHVVPIFLPALRERPEDIPLLAQHFLQRFSRAMEKEMRGFTPEALQELMGYDWPGNVRELANVVERAVALTPTNLITPDLLLLGNSKSATDTPRLGGLLTLRETREQCERTYIVRVLTTVKGNVSRAAEVAGKDRAEFYKLLRKYSIDPASFKGERAVG